MKNTITITTVILTICVLAIGFVVGSMLSGNNIVGSIKTGQEYTATTTPSGGTWTDQTIRAGWGSLGSVVITKAGDLNFQLYNATSTGAVNNDSSFNKSNNLLADFPANTVADTYIFDATYTDGLVLEVISGTQNTSTVTFR